MDECPQSSAAPSAPPGSGVKSHSAVGMTMGVIDVGADHIPDVCLHADHRRATSAARAAKAADTPGRSPVSQFPEDEAVFS